jgi:hypothetical protein
LVLSEESGYPHPDLVGPLALPSSLSSGIRSFEVAK